MIVVMGDFNAHEEQDPQKEVVGYRQLDSRHERGTMWVEWCGTNEQLIMNTCSSITTYMYSPGIVHLEMSRWWNQIDYVTINKRFRISILQLEAILELMVVATTFPLWLHWDCIVQTWHTIKGLLDIRTNDQMEYRNNRFGNVLVFVSSTKYIVKGESVCQAKVDDPSYLSESRWRQEEIPHINRLWIVFYHTNRNDCGIRWSWTDRIKLSNTMYKNGFLPEHMTMNWMNAHSRSRTTFIRFIDYSKASDTVKYQTLIILSL